MTNERETCGEYNGPPSYRRAPVHFAPDVPRVDMYVRLISHWPAELTRHLSSCVFGVWLLLRYPCVMFANRVLVSVPALLTGLALPLCGELPAIEQRWNHPYRRLPAEDWVFTLIVYCAVPLAVFAFDFFTGPHRTRKGQWIRCAGEILLVLPIWMFVLVWCGCVYPRQLADSVVCVLSLAFDRPSPPSANGGGISVKCGSSARPVVVSARRRRQPVCVRATTLGVWPIL